MSRLAKVPLKVTALKRCFVPLDVVIKKGGFTYVPCDVAKP